MNKILSGILLASCVSFCQTMVTIPPPANINDSIVHPELGNDYYSSAPITFSISDSPLVSYKQNIGDFDGDGSDDIFICWSRGANYYKKDGTRNQNVVYSYRYHYGIFSVTKSKYLLNGINSSPFSGNVVTGDFNNDQKIDFIVGNKVYLGANTLSKKKVFP